MPPPSKEHTAAQFSRQAEAYATSPSHAAGSDLDVVAAFAAPAAGERCLDIATGPGHTAFRIAASAGFVVGVDIAAGMLAAARRLAAERGQGNTAFALSDVHALAFADGSFDLATCRIAPHHFTDVPGVLREVARVLKPQGRFVVEDSLGPDDSELADFLETLEKRRDPTHVHSLSRGEWLQAMESAGLTVVRETVYEKEHDFALWIRRTGLDDGAVAAIERDILAAPAGLRTALFDIEGAQIAKLHDKKLILRVEKRG